MKKINLSWTRVITISLLFYLIGCKSGDDPGPGHGTCITLLLGDKDGFGIGLLDQQPFVLDPGTSLPVDHHQSSDPNFTDIYPAIMANGNYPTSISFTHLYSPMPEGVYSATFHLYTLGIQDGDVQAPKVSNLRLYIDDKEINNAFDDVDQFDLINNKWSEFPTHFSIEVPSSLLSLLQDGKVVVRWELTPIDPSSNSSDAFAIDYSELEICPMKK